MAWALYDPDTRDMRTPVTVYRPDGGSQPADRYCIYHQVDPRTSIPIAYRVLWQAGVQVLMKATKRAGAKEGSVKYLITKH